MKRDKCSRDQVSPSKFSRGCAFLGKDLAVCYKAVSPRECLLDRKSIGVPGQKTSSGLDPL